MTSKWGGSKSTQSNHPSRSSQVLSSFLDLSGSSPQPQHSSIEHKTKTAIADRRIVESTTGKLGVNPDTAVLAKADIIFSNGAQLRDQAVVGSPSFTYSDIPGKCSTRGYANGDILLMLVAVHETKRGDDWLLGHSTHARPDRVHSVRNTPFV